MIIRDRPDRLSRGMMDAEMIQQVRKAIARLPEHFRAALVLCEYENMSYVQIAEVLDASVPQIKTWLHRGRRQLAEKLKTYMDQRNEKQKEAR
jgi:RNA polymerase sigma-70 factor (ECF subfamily)